MEKSKFTDSQIIDTLKRAEDGLAVPEICRELGTGNSDVLQLARQLRWHGRVTHGTDEGTGGRERTSAQDVR